MLATIGFAQPEAGEGAGENGGENGGELAARSHGPEPGGEAHAEFRPLGVNAEAPAFVVLARARLARGRARRLDGGAGRPRRAAASMALFAALDVSEVVHQLDASRTGLAVLAGIVAALHLAAATGGALLARPA